MRACVVLPAFMRVRILVLVTTYSRHSRPKFYNLTLPVPTEGFPCQNPDFPPRLKASLPENPFSTFSRQASCVGIYFQMETPFTFPRAELHACISLGPSVDFAARLTRTVSPVLGRESRVPCVTKRG